MERKQELINTIKELLKEKRYKKILLIYYSSSEELPPFTSFLKSIPEEAKEKIIKYLLFVEKDPFFEKTGFLKEHFFSKLGITKKNKEFLAKRDIFLKKIKEKGE